MSSHFIQRNGDYTIENSNCAFLYIGVELGPLPEEENRLNVSQNKMLTKILGPKQEEITGG